MTQRFKIILEYDGTNYVGWQAQENGPSIQTSLENAIYKFSEERVRVSGAGRTDAGVHALGQAAHFDLKKKFMPYKLMAALNAYLKEEAIGVIAVEAVGNGFDARFSAKKRHYLYRILNRRGPAVLDKGKVWHITKTLDHEAMHKAAQMLVGKHDFTTFRSVQCQAKSPVKTLTALDVSKVGEEIHIKTSAPSFLHHQVRSMVGTLKLVGEGRWTAEDLVKSLRAKDRKALGFNAPPHGLYFVKVDY